MAVVNCQRCGTEIETNYPKSRKYCGNSGQKQGCQYLIKLERNKATNKAIRSYVKRKPPLKAHKTYSEYLKEAVKKGQVPAWMMKAIYLKQ